MTVKELIEKLQKYDENREVYTVYFNGKYDNFTPIDEIEIIKSKLCIG